MARKTTTKKKSPKQSAKPPAPAKRKPASVARGIPAPLDPIAEALARRRAALLAR